MHPALKATLFKGVSVLRFTEALPASVTYSRTGAATALTVAGLVVPFAANAPQLTDRGLLLEPAATNLVLRSKTFADSYWNQAVATITDNVALAPDGTMTAGKVVIANTTGARLATSITITVTPSTTYALAGHVKAFAAGDVGKRLTRYVYDVAAGVFKGAKAITLTADWQPVETSFTSGAGTTAVFATIAGTETGTNDTCTVLVWNGQLEPGAVATSSIYTAGSAATRGLPAATVVVPSGKTVARATYGLSNTVTDITGLTPGATFDLVTGRAWLGLGNELKSLEWRP